MSQDLILFRRNDLEIEVLPEVRGIESKALVLAAFVGKVTNAEEQKQAVEAQIALKSYLDLLEKSRKFFKQPIWNLCVKTDTTAKQLSKDASDEMMRISALVGDFQEQEKAKARSLEAARLRDLEENERKRQLELAKAKTQEEADSIHQLFNERSSALPISQAARAEGQRVTEDWEITVTDAWLLARSHPSCVDITPRIGEIKSLLRAKVGVKGIIATPVTKSGVRVPKGKVLDV